jgi:hypothetical protein
MDLADFPHLKKLDLIHTNVAGDIRNVGESDFLALESICLPKGVYGGMGHELQRISDARGVISTLHSIRQQRPILLKRWYAVLSEDSPDWYFLNDEGNDDRVFLVFPNVAPMDIVFVQAGQRIGYRWQSESKYPRIRCEVNWLDPEPSRESIDYKKYTKELQKIERQARYLRGFYEPPTREQFRRLYSRRLEDFFVMWDELA